MSHAVRPLTRRLFPGIGRGVVVTALLLSATSLAQITPLARLDCTGANFPDCGGWQPRQPSAYWSWRLVEGGGPRGGNAIEIVQTPVTVDAQYYLGWGGPIGLPHPAQGAVRFLRLRLKAIGPVNLAGVGDVWTDKFIIVADGNNPTGRIICHLRDNGATSDTLAIGCSRNIDGAPAATPLVPLGLDAWHSLQFEFQSSSTSSSTDASMKVWLDTNAYGSPTARSGAFLLHTIGWGAVSVGSYSNATLALGSRLVIQLADIEWDDEFDPSYAVGARPGPASPAALRVR